MSFGFGCSRGPNPAIVRHRRPRRLTRARPVSGGGRNGATLPTNAAPAIVSKLLGAAGSAAQFSRVGARTSWWRCEAVALRLSGVCLTGHIE
jgi:hypothetical protein